MPPTFKRLFAPVEEDPPHPRDLLMLLSSSSAEEAFGLPAGAGFADVVVLGLNADLVAEFVNVRREGLVCLNCWLDCHLLLVVDGAMNRQARGETWARRSASVARRSSISLPIR